ncbi:MAG TPA: TIGR04283 family arsenosugar biosynthesis glycosyltransferase [Thermoanaerobaculia bacterium]|nr:TIGR04283 family arsenosugar biosynthesis glycosyltransferase [Thermoanaerobaculia bacterium]
MRSTAVIIPALNEASSIERAVRSAIQAGAFEIIVADGGSADGTAALARRAGARVIVESGPRGARLNAAARQASSKIVLFLHADSALPCDGLSLAGGAIDAGFVLGGFRLRFAEAHPKLRLAAMMINLRSTLLETPWGDQGQFLDRERFLESGGFREIPIMEDYDLASRMKRQGRIVILPAAVTTSGRRFLDKGLLRTAWINWNLILAWHRGADAERLARIYRGTDRRTG